MSEPAAAPSDHAAQGWGPVQALLIGVAVFFVPQLVLGLSFGIAGEQLGWDAQAALDNLTPLQEFALSLYVALSVVGGAYWFLRRRGGWRAIKLVRAKARDWLLAVPVLCVYFATLLAALFVVEQLAPGIDLDQKQDVGFQGAGADPLVTGLAFLALVIAVPISEEILFRGILFGGFRRYGFAVAAVASAGIFAVAHGQVNVAIDTFVLGVAAAWLVERTGSLWPSIGLHMIKNSLAFYFLFYSPIT